METKYTKTFYQLNIYIWMKANHYIKSKFLDVLAFIKESNWKDMEACHAAKTAGKASNQPHCNINAQRSKIIKL